MLKNKLKYLVVPVFLLMALSARAQGFVEWIDDVQLTVPDMKVVFISDMANFIDVNNVPVYLTASGTIRSAGDDPEQRYILEFRLEFNDRPTPLIVQKSKAFKLKTYGLQDGDPIRFTNLIFIDGRFSPKQNGQNIDWESPEINEQEGFTASDLGGAQIPTGVYKMTGNFYREGQPEEPDAAVLMNITGIPSFLELIYPGAEYGVDDIPVIYQEYPVLQWRPEDAAAFSKFVVKVWERFDFQKTVDEVTQSEPLLDYTFEAKGGVFSLPYQTIPNAKPLQIGHTYVWSVDGIVPSSSGPDAVKVSSPYFVFSIKQPGGKVGSSFGEVEFILKTLFGGEIPADVVEKMSGVFFNGTIRVNGRSVSPQELDMLVKKLQGEAAADGKALGDYIKTVRVEEK